MVNLKEKFTTKDENGNELELAILRPTPKHQNQAQLVYNRALRECLESGAMFRKALDKHMRTQNLWDDEKQETFERLRNDIDADEKKLERGGIKKSEGKDIALKLKINRFLLRELIRERNELDQNTAEGQAEQHKFNYLVSVCTVYNNDGKPYFSDVESYLSKSEQQVAIDAATKLASVMYGVDSDYEYKLPENKFLKKFGYVDDKLRLVNEQGKYVDFTGHLVNDDGDRVNENGELVDENDKVVEKVEPAPFLDDDGKPLE